MGKDGQGMKNGWDLRKIIGNQTMTSYYLALWQRSRIKMIGFGRDFFPAGRTVGECNPSSLRIPWLFMQASMKSRKYASGNSFLLELSPFLY